MYKKNKLGKNLHGAGNIVNSRKRGLNTIDENTTIKIPLTTFSTTSSQEGTTNEPESSEENIPESQEQTQRYLSQRSVLAATLGRTQSRSNSSRPPNTYFELVLMKAGVQIDEGETFVLSCDHVAFVSRFQEILARAQNYPENLETFKTGLTNALAPKSKLALKLLSGCTISAPREEHVYQSQASMFVNFLMIDFLRDLSLEVLLDRIEDVACAERRAANENINLLPLMLTQLRYVTHNEQIYTRIKRAFNEANDIAKSYIISSAEFILDASKHSEFAELLIDTYSNSKDLFDIETVKTLTNLSLNDRMQARIRSRILAYIKNNQCPAATLPYLIQFLLKALTEDTDEAVRELVGILREIFNFRTGENVNTNKQDQLALFDFIEHGLTRSKRFYYIWQKTIAGLTAMQFKSFDFVILLLLIHIKDDNSLYIENILRRRIKLEHIKVDILDDIKTNFPHILEQHISTLMQILHDFMREKNKIVADFAKSAYSALFKFCDSIQQQIVKKLLELTSDKSAQHMINIALQLLKELQRKYPKDVQNWGMLLMPLLDRLSEMSLSQTRLVMELLCSIAFPSPTLSDCPALQDQIDMLVKKQLINRTAFVKKQGIISSVQLIDSIARIDDCVLDSDDFNTTYNTINELPDGRGKMAANCVSRTQSVTMNCAESLALFYDELASVCSLTPHERTNGDLKLDRPFVSWLCELMTFCFQNNFIAEHQPSTISGISLEYKMCINSLEDTTTNSEAEVLNIGINISELVLKPSGDARSSILVLAPLFNLLRVLQLQRYDGSLESINALLGCAIILPAFFDDDISSLSSVIFCDLDVQQQKQILDIYFHTVNWIRVTICAFATQREASTRGKVLQRLASLIQIEQKIKLLLMRAPSDYIPPQSHFVSIPNFAGANNGAGVSTRAKPARANRSRAKAINQTELENLTFNDTANQTKAGNHTITKLAAANKQSTNKNKANFEQLYGPREQYRQLDTDIMLLLHEEFYMKYPLEASEMGKHFGLLEFRFILTDLVNKLDSVVGIDQKSESDSTLQYIAKPYYFICDMSKFLHIIAKNMQMLYIEISVQLKEVEFAYGNGDLFTDHFNYLKVCFGLCLRLLTSFFSWSEFVDEMHSDLLKSSLLAVLPVDLRKRFRDKNKTSIIAAVFELFISYETGVVNLSTAVQLQQLLHVLRRQANIEDNEQRDQMEAQGHEIRKLCRIFLCRKWYHYDGNLEKGAQCNIFLDALIKGFLKDSDFTRQREVLRVLLEEYKQLNVKDRALKSFPNIKKANFPLLFRGLCEILITSVNDKILASGANQLDKLKIWEKSCNLLNTLLEIVQNVEQPRNFLLFLKHSHLYLKLMLQHGLPVLESNVRDNPERIGVLLKSLQQVTRFLHNLCCHSKALMNLSIVNQIPFLRETVENLVFRVKALLVANKCKSVFWMGNLVNKDLHGDTIVTQSGTFSSDRNNEEEGSDAELPEDDATVDESYTTGEGDTDSRTTAADRTRSSTRSKCY